jgi:hypothetical protein
METYRIAFMKTRTAFQVGNTGYDIAELSIAVVSGLALALTALFLCVAPLTPKIAGVRDFSVFWATGQQLVHHANPYDEAAMLSVERAGGTPAVYGVHYMRNPPWALPIAYPLGFMGVRLGTLLWSLLLLGCLWTSVQIVWQVHGRPRKLLNFLGLSFAPALMCLIVGQTAIFALLGLTLFLRLHRSKPFLAGVSLWLCLLKPHLFLAFGVVLLAWVVVNRSYMVLLGAAAALVASLALTWLMEPTAWADYAHMMHNDGIATEFIPCWSVALRLWIHPSAMWIESILPVASCVWALFFFWKRRRTWDWARDGSSVVLVSILCAPYCWLYDQAIGIPALLDGAYHTTSRILLALLCAGSVVVEVQMTRGVQLPSPFLLWTAPAWLAWYLFAQASTPKTPPAEAQ